MQRLYIMALRPSGVWFAAPVGQALSQGAFPQWAHMNGTPPRISIQCMNRPFAASSSVTSGMLFSWMQAKMHLPHPSQASRSIAIPNRFSNDAPGVFRRPGIGTRTSSILREGFDMARRTSASNILSEGRSFFAASPTKGSLRQPPSIEPTASKEHHLINSRRSIPIIPTDDTPRNTPQP